MNTTMTYDELYAVGEVDLLLEKVRKHTAAKIRGKKLAGMDIEDVMQEAALKVYRCLDKYDSSVSKLTTFIDHIIDNIISDCLRKCGRRKNLMVVNAKSLQANTSSDDDDNQFSYSQRYIGITDYGYEYAELLVDVMENMGLTEREKLVFQLFLEGYEFIEIAKVVGVTKSCMSQIWSRIKKKYNNL